MKILYTTFPVGSTWSLCENCPPPSREQTWNFGYADKIYGMCNFKQDQ